MTNPSLHFLQSEKICYYKTVINEQGVFKSEFVEIDFDENVEWLINRFKSGAKIEDVTINLIENGFDKTEIDDFLFEVIQIGLIINIFISNPYNNNKNTKIYLNSNLVNNNFYNIDSLQSYKSLSKELIDEQSNFQEKNNLEKNIFAITSFEKNRGLLSNEIKDKIKKYITFTINYQNNFTPTNDKLKKFGNKFYHSFNDEYIPISRVFNPYSGLKYPKEMEAEMLLHEDLFKKMSFNEKKDIILSLVAENDIKKNTENSFSPTFSVLFEVLICKKTKNKIIYCKGLYNNGSAIRLLSRFSHVTENICNDIAEYEKTVYKDKLIAEINMIEISRTINIFSPKQYFDHNIPLNCSYAKDSKPILLSDIYLRFDGTNFIIVSKVSAPAITCFR